MKKTNAMRLLDKAKIAYRIEEYAVDENDLSGTHVADQIGQSYEQVFKTLVLKGSKNPHMVCCIPVDKELDLKKVAKAFGEKKVEMLPLKDLLATTGYIRGGCSPIGMKKQFPTVLHETARDFEEIALSGGVRGAQVVLNATELASYIRAEFKDIVE